MEDAPSRGRLVRERLCEEGTKPEPVAELRGGFVGRGFEALQFFSGLEADGFAWRDVDLFAGPRIAADAGLARLHAEDAEAAELDALAAAERVFQRFEYRLDRLFRLGAADVWRRCIDDGIHDVQLDHTILPLVLADARGGSPSCQDVTGNLH